MGYNNLATQTLPGLIVLVIDCSANGENNQKTETINMLVNNLINEWGLCLADYDFDGNERVNDNLYIVCIVHESGKAYIYREDSISSFIDSPIAVELNVKDEFGDICDRPIYIPSISNGEQNLADALKLAKQRILEWKFAHVNSIESVSVPVVFNFLCQSTPVREIKKIEMSANSIKEVSFPDGKPILVNILLGNRYKKCYFPVHERDMDPSTMNPCYCTGYHLYLIAN